MQARIKIVSIFFFFIFISVKSVAVINYPSVVLVGDTSEKAVKKAANKIANRASLYSAILPGMGQAYNRKYWKMPIIHAGLVAFGVLIGIENGKVRDYHKELVYRYSHNLQPSDPTSSIANYSVTDINTLRIDAKKYLDFCIIGAGLVYLLNIIDANVDGHFRTFDMSDKLSLTIAPKTSFCVQNPKAFNAGLSLTLNFKK